MEVDTVVEQISAVYESATANCLTASSLLDLFTADFAETACASLLIAKYITVPRLATFLAFLRLAYKRTSESIDRQVYLKAKNSVIGKHQLPVSSDVELYKRLTCSLQAWVTYILTLHAQLPLEITFPTKRKFLYFF